MSWNERIKAAREAQKLTREQTVRKMRDYLPAGKTAAARTLVAWEQGDSEPKVTQAIALARALGYHEVSELFSQVDGPQLNRLGMDRLEEYRQLLLQSDEFREQPAVHCVRTLPVYLQPASAGTGQWLDDDLAEEMEVDDAVPARAEFGVRLAGDSMSPRFADGQIVWARKAEQAENGEIVLCVLNEQGYCKKLRYDENGVFLVSLNPKYEPIPVRESDEFRIAGVVVGLAIAYKMPTLFLDLIKGANPMCGRYQFSSQESREMQKIIRDAERRSRGQFNELNFPMAGDVAPTQVAPVLIASGDKVVAEFQRWGIPGWRGGLMINARAETVCEKPMFRRSMAAQRCVIPASGYYEWDAGKHKYFFQVPGQPIYLAGIYDNVDGTNCYVVLTTAPNSSVGGIHDRMPLILSHKQVRPWLTDPQAALTLLTIVPPALQKTCEDGQLSFADLT